MKSLFRAVRLFTLALIWSGGGSIAQASFLVDPAGGTVLWADDASYDDVVIRARPLGFDFGFFAEDPIGAIDVSTNGNLNFDGDKDYENEHVPSAIKRLSPLWDDLEIVSKSGDSIVEKVLPGIYYSVTWRVHEQGNRAVRHGFQVVLFGQAQRLGGFDFAAGDIVFSYDAVGESFAKGTASVGLDAGDDATTLPLPGATALSGLLPRAAAWLLPTLPGGFVLFRSDGEGGYTSLTNTNRAPTAVDDLHYLRNTRRAQIAVLRNDSDPDGDLLTVVSASQGAFGATQLNPDGTITYAAGPLFAGVDSFSYSVRDPRGLESTARVSVLSFSAARGTFDGLITDAPTADDPEPVPTNEGSGYLKLTLGAAGSFSGSFKYGGWSLPLQGAFDSRGLFSVEFGRLVDGELRLIKLVLRLDLLAAPSQISGTVTDTSAADPDDVRTSRVAAGRTRFDARTFAAPQAGPYTVLLRPGDGAPAGIGYARLRVAAGGGAILVGKLGDGTACSFAGMLKGDGTLPFYLTVVRLPASRSGSIFGQIRFRDLAEVSDCDATLYWFKPDVGEVAGFTAETEWVGSRYRPPAPDQRALALADTPGNAEFEIAGASAAMLTVTKSNHVRIEDPDASQLTLTLLPHAGMFIGSFLEPDPDHDGKMKRLQFRGVLLQKQKIGASLFLRAGESESVWFGPPPP